MRKAQPVKGAAASTSAGAQAVDRGDRELKKIQEACYNALLDKVKKIALELHVNTNSVMNTEVSFYLTSIELIQQFNEFYS